jgi:hypothetical protein
MKNIFNLNKSTKLTIDKVREVLTDVMLTNLFRLNRPNTVAKFVALLSDANIKQIFKEIDPNLFNSNGCKLSEDCDNQGELRSAVLKLLNKDLMKISPLLNINYSSILKR